MFQNYLKIAWRNLTQNKSHALINLFGLAIGIACCILITLWVVDELSYDKWNEKADRIYRVSSEINFGGSHRHFAVCPAPMAAALRNDFPEVETAVRFRNRGGSLVKAEDQNYSEAGIIACDSTLFDVFSIKMTEGDPKNALAAPNSVVINETTAKKYFSNDDPIGKVLTFDNSTQYTVTGVIEDMPINSHFNFDFFVSLSGNQEAMQNHWFGNNFQTYYVLREGANVADFEAKVFPTFRDKYIAPGLQQIMGKSYDEMVATGAFIKYHFMPMTDIHLHSDLEVELAANGSIQYVWIFSIIAIFILLIACVNFMNLSTAKSALRAKEIGVRKVLGSARSNLISQFFVESIMIAGFAFLLGMMLSQLALSSFNNLADKELVFPLGNIIFWLSALVGVVLIGVLAGSYPALYLSGFKPIKTLSGRFLEKGGNLSLRNGLVVFQFIIAVLLIVGTLVINDQMEYIQNKSLGFDREQVLIIDNAEPLREKAFTLKEQLLNNPKIKSATVSGFLPVPSYRSDSPLCKTAEITGIGCVSIQMWNIDDDYIETMGMEIIKGRNFSPDMPTDSSGIIINETAASILGYDDPIGQKLYGGSGFDPNSGNPMPEQTIIGVVKDFHFKSLRQNIGAVSLWLNPYPGYISLKVDTEDLTTLIPEIEQTWKSIAFGMPFAYRFMDNSFDAVYRSELRTGKIFSIFSMLSILIACLGLFGLAAFATERRTKEIGIRKVLGATTESLVALVSKDFLKPVLISLIIATPVAWYFMNGWLEDFAYRAPLSWTIFVMTGLIAIGIAFFTVSYQSFKAAMTNPIKSLRDE